MADSHNDSDTNKKSESISIVVMGPDRGEVYFKIRKTTPIEKLIQAYCERKGIAPNSVRFLFDGSRIPVGATPESLQMEDNDSIDALLEQTGGFISPLKK